MYRNVAALSAVLTLLLVAPALAFQCPADAAKIQQAIASGTVTGEPLAKAGQLLAEGTQLHQAGKHQEAVDTLAKAKELLGIQ